MCWSSPFNHLLHDAVIRAMGTSRRQGRGRRAFAPATQLDEYNQGGMPRLGKLIVDAAIQVPYRCGIDLLLAELCLPRDWHRALSELPFQKQSVSNCSA